VSDDDDEGEALPYNVGDDEELTYSLLLGKKAVPSSRTTKTEIWMPAEVDPSYRFEAYPPADEAEHRVRVIISSPPSP